MANWDHLSNIGTHPVLDPDPAVSLPAKIEAAKRRIATLQGVLDDLEEQWLEFNGGLRPGFYVVLGDDIRPIQVSHESDGNDQEKAAARLAGLFTSQGFIYFRVGA